MAATDPRRSSRARATQSQSQISSTSSSLSSRADRNSRHFKAGSPHKSTSTGSLSSEPPEDTITADDTFATRRRTRGQGEERGGAVVKTETIEMANGDDDMQEEDEAVRCICGYDDYPGPPPFDESADIDPIFATDGADDAAGFFLQCDICKVWQHGACVGIMAEELCPADYFCERCRKDLHKIFTASNGQRFSHYLPAKRQSRAASRAASLNKDGPRSPPKEKDRNGRASSATQTSKRRSTMNSREAAYDEAEALRRAIEASKEDALPDQPDGAPRRPKRVRSDSEEKQENAKRQRTSSRSVSPSPGKNADDSDDDGVRNGAPKPKSRSSAAARNQRVEKPSEREERERQRAEAANKRKGRAERRRADDSDPSEELPLAARAATIKTATATAPSAGGANVANTTTTTADTSNQSAAPEPPPPSQPATDTPSPSVTQAKSEKKRSHKKKGRNQYTRDREDSPARSLSRDIQKDDHAPSGNSSKSGGEHNKSNAKAKGGMSSKVTMTDMKRKASALLDYISRTQVDLAAETLPETGTNTPKANGGSAASVTASEKNLEDKAEDVPPLENGGGAGSARLERDFKELNCLEMMDSLARKLVKWQQEYAA